MDDLNRKKAVGSGNMSTVATTSNNASSSGYGYAPMFEALGMMGGYSSSDAMASAVSANSGTAGIPNNYRSPTDTTGMSNAEIRAAAESAATANPFSIGGVDLAASGLGMGVSGAISGAIGGPIGMLLGALGSWGAKRIYNSELRNQQTENFFNIIAQTDITADMEGRAGAGKSPINEDDPHNAWIQNNVVITDADKVAQDAAAEIAREEAAQAVIQAANASSHNGDGTGAFGYTNPASSYYNRGASNPTTSYTSSTNSWSSTGGYSSDGSTSNGSGMSGGTGGSF